MANEPYEIISSPYTVFVAPTGTTFPDIDTAEGSFASAWFKLGTSGNRNYEEEGVTVTHEQTVNLWRAAGGTGPIKALRTEEGLLVAFTLVDLSVTQYAKTMDDATVTSVAASTGTAGEDSFNFYRGFPVELFALLVRGDFSPEGDGFKSQYEVPVVYQSGSPAPQFQKGQPAGLSLEYTALEDPNASSEAERFGTFRAQDAAAT